MDENATFDDVDQALEDAWHKATVLNQDGKPTKCRELSLCITKLDEARHWLHDARAVTT
jgi:hypothetical protein